MAFCHALGFWQYSHQMALFCHNFLYQDCHICRLALPIFASTSLYQSFLKPLPHQLLFCFTAMGNTEIGNEIYSRVWGKCFLKHNVQNPSVRILNDPVSRGGSLLPDKYKCSHLLYTFTVPFNSIGQRSMQLTELHHGSKTNRRISVSKKTLSFPYYYLKALSRNLRFI